MPRPPSTKKQAKRGVKRHSAPPIERSTRQRQAIRQAIASAGRPLSTAEILAAAQREVPALGIATVYRTVKSLVEDHTLAEVVLPGENPRYELAELEHHHHFHCRACKRVYEVEGCSLDLKHITPRGFRTESHDLTLTGLCAGCAR